MANYDKFASSHQRSSADFSEYDRSPPPPSDRAPPPTASKFGPKSVFSKSTLKSLPSLRGKSQQQMEMARRNRSSRGNITRGNNNGETMTTTTTT
eukprot:CAMPEP_0201678678 /NCGR_PEP_ID=MMETSP0494-20130426/46746_1 /ASSEMBLY_ACC=CAM_ASM_000839 /TAXON_ID=420259 /ORGANISM="Thalassiosira gravida, Strain GMp14c1" /LENGTH=94 /DNA_ID=CAMNT_0048161919 /DNA_START=20 /DNA_END=301 /DNA_ORIENTATION=+